MSPVRPMASATCQYGIAIVGSVTPPVRFRCKSSLDIGHNPMWCGQAVSACHFRVNSLHDDLGGTSATTARQEQPYTEGPLARGMSEPGNTPANTNAGQTRGGRQSNPSYRGRGVGPVQRGNETTVGRRCGACSPDSSQNVYQNMQISYLLATGLPHPPLPDVQRWPRRWPQWISV